MILGKKNSEPASVYDLIKKEELAMSKFRNTHLLYMIVAILILVSLVSCAKPTPETEVKEVEVTRIVAGTPETIIITTTPEVPAAEGEPYTVEWWGAPRGEYDPMIDSLFVDSFNASHEDVQLNLVRREDREEVSRLALQAGTAPDIVQTPSMVSDLAAAGLLLPLNEYAQMYGWDEKILPWAYEASFIGHNLYSLPLTYETILLYYNKTLFEENGWEAPKTLEDIEFLCGEADKLGKVCFGSTTEGRLTRNEWWLGWVISSLAGPDKFYQTLTGDLSWTDESFARAVELQRKWIVDNEWFGGNLDNYFTITHDENWASMAAGDTLMRVAGSWDLRRMMTFCSEDCDWVIPPALNENIPPHFLLAIGETVSINADSENPDAAAMVLDYLVNDRDRAAAIIEGFDFGQWLVPLHWDASDFSPDTDPRLVRFIEEFADVTGKGLFGYTTWSFLPADTRYYLNEGFEAVMFGDITIEEYLQHIQELLESEKELIPPAPETGISQ
jgi:raffinose/stachyose/melibiose transport system substrate-binding protein